MSDEEMILEDRIRRGEQAQRILQDDLVIKVLSDMEGDVINVLKALKPNDLEGRDAAWRELRAVERFRQKFDAMIASGNKSRTLLERLRIKK